eukprot:CAMPEP_0206445394 /NCGR_PEP_ID=MMETSP0324_2-20121206/15482_1 /ASSEMBLY_ACC=CAM_ASM_000836 /TAXON_ID=2866 /ORGANISM="Crypthecodinium cohnii, Strain Seligo" /LENGTH=544 /DNA_ID=CAMNT_0053913601 /DNA_START=46 /DNA_END=1680 /DNA_ORIENTATION=+
MAVLRTFASQAPRGARCFTNAANTAAAAATATQHGGIGQGSLAEMSTESLRKELDGRGLVSGGSRAELLERLMVARSQEAERPLQRLSRARNKASQLELGNGERISAARKVFLGTNYSTTYQEPLHITRASGQYMYDGDGRQYLDGYNNVPHVGHCHPRVADAVGNQMKTLQTNTRYLYKHLPEYAARLASLFPKPLSHVFFVNSGSEANDMALRIALAHTGGDTIITHQEAYHGNTIACQGVSPTAHYNPQSGVSEGKRRSPTEQSERLLALKTFAVPFPDPYRPQSSEPLTGFAAAQKVDSVMEESAQDGGELAAMIVESILGVGGQVLYPQNYLAEVAKSVRQRKGLFILDEVQTGFGRIGSHLWAFEDPHHGGVVPDIVTLGKPMGNGFPLAAVVTTAELATVLKGEYFNTFGGAPVACAAGMAVLDVLEEEHLCSNAEWVGKFMMSELRNLSARHPCIGDVRGSGLFLGIEMVKDPTTKEPAAALCRAVVNRMKDQGVLVSYDGPLQNVIRIKPPMCFSHKNAEMLVDRLDDSITRLLR